MIASKFYATVNTTYGPVKGIRKFACYGDEYVSFQGIPYMKPPVGKLRFRDPQYPDPWTEPLDATFEGPAFCNKDYVHGRFEGSLDAMHVNVYSRNIDPEKPTPVMVFIHGGGFLTGSGRTDLYGPDYFMQKDVVLVTMNYRLHVFGFLSLKDKELGVPGNAALKDQNFALRWVKKNIKFFGGDPNNITVFGESAGGASTHYHTISNLSKGLFHRAIPMSGSALNKIWSQAKPHNPVESQVLARKLGWNGIGGEKEILEVLENADPFEIVKEYEAMKLFKEEELDTKIMQPFWPVIEPYSSENCFIPKDPLLMAREAWGNDIDVMIGGCASEGLFFLAFFRKLNEELYNFLSIPRYIGTELNLKRGDPNRKIYSEKVEKYYYGCSKPSKTNMVGYMNFLGDLYIWYGTFKAIVQRLSSNRSGKTFVYLFDYDYPKWGILKTMTDMGFFKGASHMDDLSFLFSSDYLPAPTRGTKEYEAIDRMLEIYTSFANSGDPNNLKLGECKMIPSTLEDLNCFKICEHCEYIQLPHIEIFEYLNSLYQRENIPRI